LPLLRLALHMQQRLLHHAMDPNRRPPNQQVTYLQDRWHSHPQCVLTLRDFHGSLHRSDFPVAQPWRVCPRVIRQAAHDGVGIHISGADDEVLASADVSPPHAKAKRTCLPLTLHASFVVANLATEVYGITVENL